MGRSKDRSGSWTRQWRNSVYAAALFATIMSTGCQVDIAGQTLPSPWYHYDDIQYFAPGPEFPLAREAAEMEKYRAQQMQGGEVGEP